MEGEVTEALPNTMFQRQARERPRGPRAHLRQDAPPLHPHPPRRQGQDRALALRPRPRPHHLPLQVAGAPPPPFRRTLRTTRAPCGRDASPHARPSANCGNQRAGIRKRSWEEAGWTGRLPGSPRLNTASSRSPSSSRSASERVAVRARVAAGRLHRLHRRRLRGRACGSCRYAASGWRPCSRAATGRCSRTRLPPPFGSLLKAGGTRIHVLIPRTARPPPPWHKGPSLQLPHSQPTPPRSTASPAPRFPGPSSTSPPHHLPTCSPAPATRPRSTRRWTSAAIEDLLARSCRHPGAARLRAALGIDDLGDDRDQVRARAPLPPALQPGRSAAPRDQPMDGPSPARSSSATSSGTPSESSSRSTAGRRTGRATPSRTTAAATSSSRQHGWRVVRFTWRDLTDRRDPRDEHCSEPSSKRPRRPPSHVTK